MPLLETLPVAPGTAQWALWSTTARLVVTDPDALPVARRVVADVTRQVEDACSRFRPDTEISRLPADGTPTRVSPLLAELVAAALLAAERTGGDVDPTLGVAMNAAGYDRDVSLIDGALIDGAMVGDGPIRFATQPARRPVTLDGDVLTVPAGVRLDLGATAKAWTADRCAARVAGRVRHRRAGGARAATSPPPARRRSGWQVLVRDRPTTRPHRSPLGAGRRAGHVQHRRAAPGGRRAPVAPHPRPARPARRPAPVWRTVSGRGRNLRGGQHADHRGRRARAWTPCRGCGLWASRRGWSEPPSRSSRSAAGPAVRGNECRSTVPRRGRRYP